MRRKIAILGSTGSVGTQIVELIHNFYKDIYKVELITGHNNFQLLLNQAKKLQATNIGIANKNHFEELKNLAKNSNISILCTEAEIINQLIGKDLIFIASSGIEALKFLYFAVKKNIPVATANKESIICGGNLLSPYVKNILPLDSEHFAIWQLLNKKYKTEVEKITLTATGGPFFNKKINNITVESALNHPIWKMGKKISIDSATMMNKVFEIIEAHYLFNFPKDQIEILIHPEAIIHGLVKLKNGTEEALLFPPSMGVGINDVLAKIANIKPEQIKINKDFTLAGKSLSFFNPSRAEFPALEFLDTDQHIILVAADDIAVDAFLKKKISFENITKIISLTLEKYNYSTSSVKSIGDVLEIYKKAKSIASCLQM